MGCPTEEYELQFQAEATQFSLLRRIHIDLVKHQIPLSNKYLGLFTPWVKRSGRKSKNASRTNASVFKAREG